MIAQGCIFASVASTTTATMVYRIALCILLVGTLSAQDGVRGVSPAPEKPKETVALYLRFPVGRLFDYVLSDTTRVHRIYSDSSTLDYVRTLTYYLSLEAVKVPQDGLVSVQVTIDSLRYSFSSGGNTISYAPGDQMPLQFPDFVAAVVPVNRQFTMYYSPYWDVAKVEGEMLDWLRDYIAEGAEKVSSFDSLQKFVWLRNISLPVLAHYADPQKGVLPHGRVTLDSTWAKPFVCLADGIEFRDPASKTRIIEQRGPIFVLQSRSDSLLPKLEALKLYNIGRFVSITGGNASCTHTVELHKAGFVQSAVMTLTGTVTCKVRNETFEQHIQSRSVWTLRGQYDY